MQDDVSPGWAKKPKPPVREGGKTPESDNPLDTTIGGDEPDIVVDEPEPKSEETVDEKKLEEEYGPAPATSTSEEDVKQAIHKRPWTWLKNLSTTRKIVYGILLLLIIAAGVVCYIFLNKSEPIVPSFPTYHAPTSKTEPSKLTGLQVDPAINKLQVTGVMIENSVFARPQSSLNQAGIVYEAIAEAGITRFLALFQDTQSDYIGPVRSARPYYVQWCQAFDCALAHVGGSPEALSDIQKWHVKNLDQFVGSQYFHRINSRYAPHNMYTSQANLTSYEKARGYTGSEYIGFEHLLKEPKVTAKSVTTTSIHFNYPGTAYDVSYSYQLGTNDYLRSEGGAIHKSVDSAGKLRPNTPKVVVALVVPYAHKADGYHSDYNSIGSGPLYVFQNGLLIQGTWARTARDSNFVFKNASGQPIKLTPGQTWISVLSSTSDVTYK